MDTKNDQVSGGFFVLPRSIKIFFFFLFSFSISNFTENNLTVSDLRVCFV